MKDLLLLFRNNGWHWEGPLLVDVIRTLQAQGVADSTALISLDLNDVAGAELWPTEVRAFIEELGTSLGLGLRCSQVSPKWLEPKRVAGASRPVCQVAQPSIVEHVVALTNDLPTQVTNFAGAGPCGALQELKRSMPTDPVAREAWRKKARIAAVMGSCPDSQDSFKSGVRHWIKVRSFACTDKCPFVLHWNLQYIHITHGTETGDDMAYPPQLEDILGWSNTFRLTPLSLLICVLCVRCLRSGV